MDMPFVDPTLRLDVGSGANAGAERQKSREDSFGRLLNDELRATTPDGPVAQEPEQHLPEDSDTAASPKSALVARHADGAVDEPTQIEALGELPQVNPAQILLGLISPLPAAILSHTVAAESSDGLTVALDDTTGVDPGTPREAQIAAEIFMPASPPAPLDPTANARLPEKANGAAPVGDQTATLSPAVLATPANRTPASLPQSPHQPSVQPAQAQAPVAEPDVAAARDRLPTPVPPEPGPSRAAEPVVALELASHTKPAHEPRRLVLIEANEVTEETDPAPGAAAALTPVPASPVAPARPDIRAASAPVALRDQAQPAGGGESGSIALTNDEAPAMPKSDTAPLFADRSLAGDRDPAEHAVEPRSEQPTSAAAPSQPPPAPPAVEEAAADPIIHRPAAHPVVEQVVLQLAKAAGDTVERIKIELRPIELGRVDVRMEIGPDGHVQAVFAADRPQTLELLQRDARQLERALLDAGLNVDSGSLTFDLGGQGNAGNFARADRGPAPIWPAPNVPAELVAASQAYVAPAGAAGRLDIRV